MSSTSAESSGRSLSAVPAVSPNRNAPQSRRGLSAEQTQSLTDALRSLQSRLRGLLATLPVEAQTASGLARALKIERTTCQRAVSAAQQAGTPSVALSGQLPGVEGLRKLAGAAQECFSAGSPEMTESIVGLRTAIDAYAALVRRIAGSRSKLLAMLEPREEDSPLLASRHAAHARQLFEAAAALTGRFSQTWLAVHVYEPGPRPDRVIQTRADGLIGHMARPEAVPLTFHVFAKASSDDSSDSGDRFEPLVPAVAGEAVPAEILREFSTSPPPIVRARQPHEFLVQAVDPTAGDACDLIFGLRGQMGHPAASAPFSEEVWALINFPARWLLLDVFLHRDLARRCIPELDMHLWRPDFASTIGERWQTRFAHAPRLEALGGGLQQVESQAYARQPELLRYLFAQRGLSSADYVGYRCQVAYPLWRTGYRMSFDFGDGGTTSPSR